MISTVGQNNAIQRFNAVSSFKNNQNRAKQEKEQNTLNTPEISSGTNSNNAKSLLDLIDINDLRECAKSVGEFNITDDDIKYGLMYGRSVIAEFIC